MITRYFVVVSELTLVLKCLYWTCVVFVKSIPAFK